jgi:hypothetical protein
MSSLGHSVCAQRAGPPTFLYLSGGVEMPGSWFTNRVEWEGSESREIRGVETSVLRVQGTHLRVFYSCEEEGVCQWKRCWDRRLPPRLS